MLMRGFRRSPKRRLLRAIGLVLGIVVVFDVLNLLKFYRAFSRNLTDRTYTELSTLPLPAQNQKIFICAQFWTNAKVIEERWGAALIDLIGTLGVDNVYVSIYESGSLDNTKDIIQYLDQRLSQLKVTKKVVLDPTTHEDVIKAGPLDDEGNPKTGWIQTRDSYAGKELRRIPYLARLRNLALNPLHEERSQGREYDKILFLNDVAFRPSDVLSLLATNQGSYAAACALDFSRPPAYYDTFALRDSSGDATIMSQFPYFRSLESRNAILQGSAVKVQSCWNGMVAMDAAPFYNDQASSGGGLSFRGVADSLASKHVEGSECCLIYADLARIGAADRGIFLNPAVRVGYTSSAYDLVHSGPENTFVTSSQYVTGVWLNRVKRLVSNAESRTKEVREKLQKWQKDKVRFLENRDEPGAMCLIDEMHILVWNGWKHI